MKQKTIRVVVADEAIARILHPPKPHAELRLMARYGRRIKRQRTARESRLHTEPAMPIYEYACHACGREFEALVRSNTVPQCPHCQSTQLEKRLSVFATSSAAPEATPMMSGPCGTCGHPDGPGSCTLQ